MAPLVDLDVLPAPAWRARRAAHEARVDGWIRPVLERAARRERHPVEDFMFTYYSYRPAQLRRWSPGIGISLADASLGDVAWPKEYADAERGLRLRPPPPRVSRTAAWVADLLDRTAGRDAHFGCFGLHEWAMVHRQQSDDVRHRQWPLRLGASGTAEVVESLPIRCSHFDAFRFFAPPARALNVLQPTRATTSDLEQAGCLHANMDLYKWSYKLSPWVPAELVADCFDLARRVRELDMRASPYDLSTLGYPPVRIETAAGRREYADAQRRFAAEARPLRVRLAEASRRLA